jgi:alpha-amylase/alpha-mannosidase (GH57 family)
MIENRQLDIVFCWHMHQPQYRRARDGSFQLPWTYLHAIKDYTDMAWYLEQVPDAKAVVNFTPVLLDQLDDYARQFSTREFHDPLLRALADPASPAESDVPELAAGFFRANVGRMIRRFAPYARLHDIYESARTRSYIHYLSREYLADLAVWYHLAWLGETIRRNDIRAQRLTEKGEAFDEADRSTLLELLGDAVRGIVPRYRALSDKGRVELSTSPFAHPIVPLLIDFATARESQPDATLPSSLRYPGGVERATEHIGAAIVAHAERFGAPPAGCWPSEGGLSKECAALFADAGFAWTASCESVLVKSLQAREVGLATRSDYLYKPYRIAALGREISCFFRDVHLSDLIGFRYAEWHGDDAVSNFVGALEAIADATADNNAPVVSIILDGENAWEHYPENGYYFLSNLYRAIAAHPRLRLTTFSAVLQHNRPTAMVDKLVAGSWVYGTFSTWIGDPDKNRAWDLLVDAKSAFDDVVASGRLNGATLAKAETQLKVCEGSDWFWWFGDYNPAQTVSDFDRLFRDHLRDFYTLIGVAPPAELEEVIGVGAGTPLHGGTMRANLEPGAPR